MDRTRSISESQYHVSHPPKKSYPNHERLSAQQIKTMKNSSSLSALSPASTPNKSRRDSAKTALNKVLADYKFLGNIVAFKTKEAYGFIRSEQVTGDIFFSPHHFDNKQANEDVDIEKLLGKWVHFTVKDVGKTSMEARKVSLVAANTSVTYLKGRVMSWVKTGCLIQVTSGFGLANLNNRIFAPFVETKEIEQGATGTEVCFKIHVDRNFKKEGRDVSKTEKNSEEPDQRQTGKMRKQRRRAVTEGTPESVEEPTEAEKLMSVKELTTEEFSDELVTSIESLDNKALIVLFDKQLKARLSMLAQQPVGSKVIISVIKRAALVERTNNIEEKITRMIMANFLDIVSTKHGCAVVQAGLEHFSQTNKVMLAELLIELDTVEQFTSLWVQGSYIFSMMLNLLDESSLALVGLSLSGHYLSLACHIRHYKPVKSLLVNLVNTDSFNEILPELEKELVSLSCNKFGHIVVSALLQNTPHPIKARLITVFGGQLAPLSIHPVCHSVIVTALEEANDTIQAAFIEEVCTVSSNQADMAVIRLTKDRFGHLVVLAMLKVSRHKQVHNVLKASILCKQEEVVENEFVAKVLKSIKTEFHSRSVGNYCKRDH